jgi:type VI secretion system protein ImpM
MVMRTQQPESIVPQAFGWHGKLPTRGDFVGRGLPRAFLRTWDEWLQRSLAHASEQLGSDSARQRLLAMPPWQGLVLPPAQGLAWSLVVVPSSDRVGRTFPLVLAEAYPRETLERVDLGALRDRALHLSDWLDRIGALAAPKDFESGAAELTARPWPAQLERGRAGGSVATLIRQHGDAASFWWQPEPLVAMQAPRVEAWPPSEALLLAWIGAAG